MSEDSLVQLFADLQQLEKPGLEDFQHTIYSLSDNQHLKLIQNLLKENPSIRYTDTLLSQCRELVKVEHPAKKWQSGELESAAKEYLAAKGGAQYGNLVYYPWKQLLVRLLPEEEFIRLRTSRNKYKITEAEQDLLRTKTVGVIGLSVGQSVAITMTMERIYGRIRLADFDDLELSNLNRIRKGVDYLGATKIVMVAREIAEIDPYIQVEVFPEGITDENLKTFIGEGKQQLDALIEECDSFPIKIKARLAARKAGIPVLMDTSDRGMLDIERFDLEPDRPILHGLVAEEKLLNVGQLNEMQRMAVLFDVVGGEKLSARLKASLLEMNQSLTSWPQLASSVTLGGAIVTDALRRIFLGKKVKSGRLFIDMDTLIPEEDSGDFEAPKFEMPPAQQIERAIDAYLAGKQDSGMELEAEEVEALVEYAGKAPSSGNDQPWEFHYKAGRLFVVHRKDRSYSFGDFRDIASVQSIGAAVENLRLKALDLGYNLHIDYTGDAKTLLKCVLSFERREKPSDIRPWLAAIEERHTNRVLEEAKPIDPELLDELKALGEEVRGTEVRFITDRQRLLRLGHLVSAADKIRVLNPWGHYDFFHREMRWTPEEAKSRGDGIDIRTLEIAPEMMGAIKMLKEDQVVDTLRAVNGGDGFNQISLASFATASAVGLVTRQQFEEEEFFKGGMAWERIWLKATEMKLGVHPLIAPLYLFPRLLHGGGQGLDNQSIERLKQLRPEFLDIWQLEEGQAEIFMFKLFKTNHQAVRTYRLPLDQILTMHHED